MEKASGMIKLLILALVASEVVVLPVLGTLPYGGDGHFQCPQAIFVFGDSLTDTGNTQAAFPGVPGAILNYPYGESYTFTDKPGRNRYSDGRLVIDFVGKCTLPIVSTYQQLKGISSAPKHAFFEFCLLNFVSLAQTFLGR